MTSSQDISQEELDFSDLFLYNASGEEFLVGCDKVDAGALLQSDNQPPLLVADPHSQDLSASNQTASSQNPSHHSATIQNLSGAGFDSWGLISRPGNIPAPSPRIEITPSGDSLSSQTLEPSPGSKALGAYRECVSPASSNSSTGWPAEAYSPVASPCVSPSNGGGCNMGLSALDLCPGLQSINTSSAHSSPGASPRNSIPDETILLSQHLRTAAPITHQRSRSASPHVKRTYDQAHSNQEGIPVKQRSRSPSPIPSPHEQQGSYYLHQYQAPVEFQAQGQTSFQGLDEDWNSSSLCRAVPSAVAHNAHGRARKQDCVYGEGYEWVIQQEKIKKTEANVKSETFYMLPAVWHPPPQPVHPEAFSGFSLGSPLPSLEWSLPSQYGQYNLLVQQQPRSHHRAQYETEGSRGPVKTPNGGHPEVQLCGYQGTAPLGLQIFIGTADERLLKPHAFYQVHRITGKTVTTPSIEMVINGTKVVEIPLEPKNHMRVLIDCVGILKLRNADIELRNGETDVGRKNTRVRLVFRVHIPQSGNQVVSLQVASDPIECSQRSAQELPAVERQDLEQCSVLGGQQMVLTGQNFTPDSKVLFSEKTQDGQQIWEVEATVDRDKTQANMLFVEVPPYRDRTIYQPAKVNFYVINGKKKRSQPQHFTYTPLIAIKSEPLDDYQFNSYSYSESLQALNAPPTLYHLTTVDPRACMVTPEPLDNQPVYYQSKNSTLINSPLSYHTVNQHYSNCGTALLSGSPKASHSASSPSQCISVRNPVGKLNDNPQVGEPFEASLVSTHKSFMQTVLPLGKSSRSRYIQGQAQGKAGYRIEPGRENNEVRVPERVTVKQENLNYAYLEDVNDIIKRDLKGHSGE